MPEFGISPIELADISSEWREGGRTITDNKWSAFREATGSGSDVLAAIRDCAEPAAAASYSIGDRLIALGWKVTHFAANTVELDGSTGSAITEMPPR
jgi:hypothetical protein